MPRLTVFCWVLAVVMYCVVAWLLVLKAINFAISFV